MRFAKLSRGAALALALSIAFAPTARAGWSEQGVLLDSLQHPFTYQQATMLHDAGGALFMLLPYSSFGGYALGLNATQSVSWDAWQDDYLNTTGLALDGAGGMFTLAGNSVTGYEQLRHYLASGAQDLGAPPTGLAVGPRADAGRSVLLADGSGGAWGAWCAFSGLRLQHWLAGGAVAPGWGPTGRLFPMALSTALASDGNGGVILFYVDFPAMHARVTRVLADTTIAPGWTAAGIDLGAANQQAIVGPADGLVPSGADHWIATWLGDDPGNHIACARRFGVDGTLDPAWYGGATLPFVTGAGNWTGTRLKPLTCSDGSGGFQHVWADSVTGLPRWLHVNASGGYAPNFGWNGISVLRGADALSGVYSSNFVATPSDNGGIVLAWDDAGTGRAPAIRLRWLMPDGSNDPAAPEAGRMIPGTDVNSLVWGLAPDGGGGVWSLWSVPGAWSYTKIFYVDHMARTPYVADVPSASPAGSLALAAPYPNPARTRLDVRFTLPDEHAATLALYDVGGRLQRRMTVQGAGPSTAGFAHLEALPPGVYLLRLSHGGTQRTERVAIVR